MPENSIHIQNSIRPIRLAFLVQPDDGENLQKIFEVNTCRWGGKFNGIIPVFQKTPKWWGRELGLPNAAEIAQGYLEAFEPDYVITTRSDLVKKINFDKERIITMDDVFKDSEDFHVLYGINVDDIHKELYEKQFKFIRRHKVKAAYPVSAVKQYQHFCSAVFGSYPEGENYSHFLESYKEIFEPEILEIKPDNLFDLLTKTSILPIETGSKFIKKKRVWSREPTLFLLDPNKPADLIDFWNLRALGWTIYPIPREWVNKLAPACKQFVKDKYVPIKGNPNGIMRNTNVLKSRHIDASELKAFLEQIVFDNNYKSIGVIEHPRIWDSWAREKDNAERCLISHDVSNLESKVKNNQIIFPSLGPRFIENLGYSNGNPRWANIVQFRSYSYNGDDAFVFPPDLINLDKLFETLSYRRMIFPNSEGVVALVGSENSKMHWHVPTGFTIFQTWFKEKGLKADLSPPGSITQHLVNALGGLRGVHHIANLAIIKLLDKMAHGLVEVPTEEDASSGKPHARSRMESWSNWWAILLEVNKNRSRDIKNDLARRHLKILIERGVLRLGLHVKCTECEQANWYSLGEIQERIQCERCLRLFSFPVSEPPQKSSWYYRTHGSFSVEDYAQGSYSVALAVRFLVKTMEADSTWTPSLKISGPKDDLECDFAIWRRTTSRYGTFTIDLVFGECKSFDEFKEKDIDRAKLLAEKFPGAVLILATMRRELNELEKKRLSTLASWGREGIGGDKWRAPLIILTAYELFSNMPPPHCWKEAEGKFDKFSEILSFYDFSLNDLADATQQLHLDMEPYFDYMQKY